VIAVVNEFTTGAATVACSTGGSSCSGAELLRQVVSLDFIDENHGGKFYLATLSENYYTTDAATFACSRGGTPAPAWSEKDHLLISILWEQTMLQKSSPRMQRHLPAALEAAPAPGGAADRPRSAAATSPAAASPPSRCCCAPAAAALQCRTASRLWTIKTHLGKVAAWQLVHPR